MSVHYVVCPKENPKDKNLPVKYYAISKSLKPIGRDSLIEDMVKNTSLNYHEASAGIDYLFKTLPKYLSMGFTVQLGKIGHFKLAFRSEGMPTPEEVTPDKITHRKLIFVCGKEIREAINEFRIEKFPESKKQ